MTKMVLLIRNLKKKEKSESITKAASKVTGIITKYPSFF